MNKYKIAIVGAGGFGLDTFILLKRKNLMGSNYDFIGVYDDNESLNQTIFGLPYLGKIENLNYVNQDISVAIAVGEPFARERIRNKIQNPLVDFPVLIDPSVIYIDDLVKIGEGCIILNGTSVSGNIIMGRHCIINQNCTIGHDSVLHDFSSIMPGANISGDVVLGNKTYIGTGAQVINQRSIGAGTIVGAGATVTRDLPNNVTAVGVPAVPISCNPD
jgi:sugar O-acyltransferase (sialic acid O-acetyltransferase NeuD family)